MDRRERVSSLTGAQVAAMNGRQAKMWTAMPAIVQSFNAADMTVKLQIAIKGQFKNTEGVWTDVEMPELDKCPVVFPFAGGFGLTLPIAEGDEGIVLFASRCIDAWWQNGGLQSQAEFRMHDLSDGMFLPCMFSKPRVLANVSTTGAQMRNEAGTAYIEIGPDGIKIVGSVMIDGDVTHDGNLGATGNVIAGVGTPDQVTLRLHVHPTAATGAPSPPTPGT